MEKEIKQSESKKIFLAGLITENPTFVSLLGMCPTLATTKSVEAALGMGILVILVLIGSNILISLLRKIIPSEVKIPCYIVIIASLVTIIKMLTEAFVPALYSSLGVFISLIVVNCIILGRAEAFASKNGVKASFFDALGSGVGFTVALCVVAFIREFLGTGALSFGVYFPIGTELHWQIYPSQFALSIFVQSAGGFLALAMVLAFLAWRKNRSEAKKLAAEKARIEELKKKKAEELAKKKALEAEQAKANETVEAPKQEEKTVEVKQEVKEEVKAEPKVEEAKAPEAKKEEAPQESTEKEDK